MELIRDPAAFPESCRRGLVSIGKFDGLHVGHAEILRTLTAESRTLGLPSVVMTFDPPPVEILRPALAVLPLCTLEHKIERIRPFSPDLLLVFPTTREFLELSADEFFKEILRYRFDACGLVEGSSFTFGRNRQGDCNRLRAMCDAAGMRLTQVPSVRLLGRDVSSSRIRSVLREGHVAEARGMLGAPYRMTGYVVHGDHRGGRLGFPTANLGGVKTILPKAGLYAARAVTEFGEFSAAVHLGGNPTFGIAATKIEAHLLDFSGDLYGRTIHLDFYSRLRDVVTFDSSESLIEQMNHDLTLVRDLFAS